MIQTVTLCNIRNVNRSHRLSIQIAAVVDGERIQTSSEKVGEQGEGIRRGTPTGKEGGAALTEGPVAAVPSLRQGTTSCPGPRQLPVPGRKVPREESTRVTHPLLGGIESRSRGIASTSSWSFPFTCPHVVCLPHPSPLGTYTQAWERPYALTKARRIVDGVNVITKCPAAARAKTPETAKAKRMEAAPAYLRGRVERDMELPDVAMRGLWRRNRRRRLGEGAAGSGGGGGEDEEDEGEGKKDELRAVVGYVVKEMKGELVVDLMEYLEELVR